MAEASSAEAHASKNLQQLIAHYTERPLLFAPGSKWQYCQAGINTLRAKKRGHYSLHSGRRKGVTTHYTHIQW